MYFQYLKRCDSVTELHSSSNRFSLLWLNLSTNDTRQHWNWSNGSYLCDSLWARSKPQPPTHDQPRRSFYGQPVWRFSTNLQQLSKSNPETPLFPKETTWGIAIETIHPLYVIIGTYRPTVFIYYHRDVSPYYILISRRIAPLYNNIETYRPTI